MADEDGADRRARLAQQGKGAWADIAAGRSLAEELIAERRLEAAIADADPGRVSGLIDQLRR